MVERPEVRVNGYISRNETILKLARRDHSGRPLEEVVRDLARDKLAEADALLREIDEKWAPPPFDPFLVAQALGIRCLPVEESWLKDAMICVYDGILTILFRPQRSTARTHFNIFHEIAHTLFPDYHYNHPYQHSRRPRLFEPEGQLEYLCDIAAAEFLMPMDLFSADLADKGFGAGRVDSLCRCYGASMEAVCLRMVESNLEECTLALVEHRYQRKSHRRKDRELPPEEANPARENIRVVYSAPSRCFRARKLFIPPHLAVGHRSCIHQAARSKKPAMGEECLELGRGQSQQFYIEALPVTSRPRRHGRSPVLAFFYPR